MLRPLVVYITTHCSASHNAFLGSSCWRDMIKSLPPHTDIAFYITHPRCAQACVIPDYFDPKFIVCEPQHHSKQSGATGALYNRKAVKALRAYTWVMRLNPDTIVYNARYILGLRRPPYDAIIATCRNNTNGLGVAYRAHTDFAVFQPKILGGWQRDQNAERDFTIMLRRASNPLTLWENPTGRCRINFPGVVVHAHTKVPTCSAFTAEDYIEQVSQWLQSL